MMQASAGEPVKFKKWVWSFEGGLVLVGMRWFRKQIVTVAVVEDTAEKAESFARGDGVVRPCTCSVENPTCCPECLAMYAASPRYV